MLPDNYQLLPIGRATEVVSTVVCTPNRACKRLPRTEGSARSQRSLVSSRLASKHAQLSVTSPFFLEPVISGLFLWHG